MSGVNYRGRRRLRDRGGTERLRALLAAAADTDDEDVTGAPDPEHLPGDAGKRSSECPGVGRLDPECAPASSTDSEHAAEDTDSGRPHAPDHLEAGPGTGNRRRPVERDPARGALHRQSVRVRHTLATPAAVVLALALAVVCAVAVLSLARGDPSPVLEATLRPGAEGPSGRSSDGAPAPGASLGAAPGVAGAAPPIPAGTGGAGAPPGTLTVHIAGEVKAPGVVEVSPGARVIDAVEAAGGLTERAVTDRVNLAEPLSDGQQVIIPDRETADAPTAGPGAGSPGAVSRTPGAVAGGGAGTAAGANPGTMINLNTATAAELETLPRVGPVLAQRIVDFRTQHGPFTAPEQLDDVSGIGPAMLEALLPLVTI